MIISNSLGKNRVENLRTSTPNVFGRSDGFKTITKGFSTNKLKAKETNKHKLHTSSGFRRHSK